MQNKNINIKRQNLHQLILVGNLESLNLRNGIKFEVFELITVVC